MEIKITGHTFEYDAIGMSLLFFPGESVVFTKSPRGELRLSSRLLQQGDVYVAKARFCYRGKVYSCCKRAVGNETEQLLAAVKYSIYQVFHRATGISPPWGILTGIKPTGIYRRFLNEMGYEKTRKFLLEEYCMQPEKIPLLHQICMVMDEVQTDSKKEASLYVAIPFCPSRCSYCSFISVAAEKSNRLIDSYLQYLKKEIEDKCSVLHRSGLKIRSVYVGGGTPGILTADQIEALLGTIIENTGNNIEEFTFELGRPDTVSEEKLAVLKKYGVTRVCINTQTTNDEILSAIGRRHTKEQYLDAVSLTKKFQFNSINTDLIAGLPGETEESFAASLKDVLSAGVDNITIHTLSIKRSSKLYGDGTHFDPKNDRVQRMLDDAYDVLRNEGLVPYYMYRQKNTVSNGENIGFSIPEKICAYNLYMMEDLHTIAACGAGASSKIIAADTGRIERVINMKYPYEYINENEKISKNTILFEQKLKENL